MHEVAAFHPLPQPPLDVVLGRLGSMGRALRKWWYDPGFGSKGGSILLGRDWNLTVFPQDEVEKSPNGSNM